MRTLKLLALSIPLLALIACKDTEATKQTKASNTSDENVSLSVIIDSDEKWEVGIEENSQNDNGSIVSSNSSEVDSDVNWTLEKKIDENDNATEETKSGHSSNGMPDSDFSG